MLPTQVSQTIALLRSCENAKYAEQTLSLAIAYSLPICDVDDNKKAHYLAFEPSIKKLISKINEFQVINVAFVLDNAAKTYSERVKITYFPWARGTDAMVDVYDKLDDDVIAAWDDAMRKLLVIFKETLRKE